MAISPPSASQIRNSIQVGFAGFLAAGLLLFAGENATRIDAFYLVYGVARSLLPTPEASMKAARARVIGTVFGGVVVALLMQSVSNWLAVGMGYILIKVLGRRIGLNQATLMNAVIMAILLVAIPGYKAMGWQYVLYRSLWHLVGLMIGMAVERLFWFTPLIKRLQRSEASLIKQLDDLLDQSPAQLHQALINSYAAHCTLRGLVLRSDQASMLTTPDSQKRQEWLERAVRHGVARQRVPEQLQEIDTEDCKKALHQLKSCRGSA